MCKKDLSSVLDAIISMGERLGTLANDAFGNYVVKRALQYGDEGRRKQLVELLLPSLPSLSKSKNGSYLAQTIIDYAGSAELRQARAHPSP